MGALKEIFYIPICLVMTLHTRLCSQTQSYLAMQNTTNESNCYRTDVSVLVFIAGLFPLTDRKGVILYHLPLLSSHQSNSPKWQLDHIMNRAHVDSVKRPFISPPAVTEVKVLNNHLITVPAYSSQMAPKRNNSQWQVSEGGEMQLSLFDWVNSCEV